MFTYEYERPSMSCDVVLISMQKPVEVLLITRLNDPYANTLALPGGFMNMNERLHECAARELLEETGIDANFVSTRLEFLGVADAINRDVRQRTLSGYFLLESWLPKSVLHNMGKAGDDAKSLKWVKLRDIFSDTVELAFDHRNMIEHAFDYIHAL
jgi:8-oxo-dGTP diphosphatase